MEQLPKAVRERMAAAERGVSSHPDADALNAFAENALLGSERERVLQHLSSCGECRDVVALSLPQDVSDGTANVVALPETSVVRRWAVWQWAGLAAATVIIFSVGLLYESKIATERKQDAVEVPASLAPAAPAAAKTTNEQLAEETPATLSQQNGRTEATSRARSYATAVGKPARGASPRTAQAPPVVPRQSSHTDIDIDEAKPLAIASQQARETVVGGIVNAPMYPTATAPAGTSRRVAGGNQIQNVQAQAAPVQVQPPVAPAPAAGAQRVDKAETFGNYDAVSNSAAGTNADLKLSEPNNIVVNKVDATQSLRKGAAGAAKSKAELRELTANARAADLANTAVSWRISDAGTVERAGRDTGWRPAMPAKDVEFRAVASAERDVWAGGSNGALFHSADAGESWVRVTVAADGQALASDVAHIELRTAREVEITTSSGQKWTTRDGGNTWTVR